MNKIKLLIILILFFVSCKKQKQEFDPSTFLKPVEISIFVRYKFDADTGIIIRQYNNMTITCYSNRKEETDGTPNNTATGRTVYDGSCAVSQDLFRKEIFPGDIVYVKKLGRFFIVEDTTNQRHKRLIDIFYFRDEKPPLKGSIKDTIYVIQMPHVPKVQFQKS